MCSDGTQALSEAEESQELSHRDKLEVGVAGHKFTGFKEGKDGAP